MLWSFKRLSASPANSCWQTETLLLFTAGCYLDSFPSSGAVVVLFHLGFGPHTYQGEPLCCWISVRHFSATHGSPASPFMSPPHSVPVTLWWSSFFSLSVVIRLLSSSCSVGYFGWFLFNLVLIPDWSWEEFSVASTYSSTTLDPGIIIYFNIWPIRYFETMGKWMRKILSKNETLKYIRWPEHNLKRLTKQNISEYFKLKQ